MTQRKGDVDVKMIEKRMRMRGQGGFTLIELLVVVAILAILAGVAIFAVGSLQTDADVNACKVERDTIKTAAAAKNATSTTSDSVGTYLDGSPKYFAIGANGITGTTAKHPGGDCPAS